MSPFNQSPELCLAAGEGTGFCDGHRFPVQAGEVVIFPPTSLHGIDNGPGGRMYCLEFMDPNDMFAELVLSGTPAGSLSAEDLCTLISAGCGNT